MQKGMIWSFATATLVALALTLFVGLSWLRIFLLILTVILAGMTVWTILMYRAFSYNGKRQMSRQIIDGVAEYVKLPDGGRGLDVGCGSGALTIAVAKRNPQGSTDGARSTPPLAKRSARIMPMRKALPKGPISPKGMP